MLELVVGVEVLVVVLLLEFLHSHIYTPHYKIGKGLTSALHIVHNKPTCHMPQCMFLDHLTLLHIDLHTDLQQVLDL